ncbi:MAG: nitrogenase molybdenum-cofactor biosynthesis protein NifE, partial [Spirochaetae bacterium HGW-Spirochaetae-10]
MIVLQCIADCAHLVHGPIACAGNSYESRGTLSHKGILHRRSYTTDIGELDIVYGAEQRLFKAIELTIADARPQAVFVYATCVTGLIGEDVRSVCRRATESFGIPVIPVEAPGFVGPKNLGNRIAGDVLLEFVIGTQEPPLQTPTDIVLVGEYNIAGDLDLVEPLFHRAGIRILSRITGNASYSEVCQAHRARATGVVCGRALINVARELEVRYGIPFREISFYGRTEMSRALRSMAEMLVVHDPAVIERVESVIRDEEASLQAELRRYDHLKGKRAVLYTGGVKSWSIIQALMDLGIEVVDRKKFKMVVGSEREAYTEEWSATPDVSNSIRMYLSEMGKVPLLTRDEEVTLARNIRERERELRMMVLESPITMREIRNWETLIEQDEMTTKELMPRGRKSNQELSAMKRKMKNIAKLITRTEKEIIKLTERA